ncbi:MAG TPA: hypothetical protein VFS21_13550 [Roseiflexaceae bacterium]|nr:hypothetical protein [Roseiflexaceae bacterium]
MDTNARPTANRSMRRWTFSQPIADVDPAAWGGALIAHDDR